MWDNLKQYKPYNNTSEYTVAPYSYMGQQCPENTQSTFFFFYKDASISLDMEDELLP